jgi:hypothetical protein
MQTSHARHAQGRNRSTREGLDGRIDDAKAGWKGRGLWSTVSSRTPFHMETGRGTPPIVMHFQLRPNPLAK